MNKNKTAAIYARVSTSDQHPENQIEALKKYALDNGYLIYKEYADVISGVADTRPALNDLMIDSRAGKFDTILIWQLDRLGRSLQHLIHVVEELQLNRINLISTTQGFINTSGPTGKLIFQFFGAMAEFERGLIQERVKLAVVRAKKEGRPWGRPKGSKDDSKRKRRKGGYIKRWDDPTERRNMSNILKNNKEPKK